MAPRHVVNDSRFERLRTLTEVSRALTYTTSIEDVLQLTVERAAELMGAEKSLIMLTDDDGLLVVRAAHGVEEDRLTQFREPLQETLVRRLRGLLDCQTEDSFSSVPLVVQGEVTGLLAAVRTGGGPVDDDEWLLSALADQAAVAIENARLTRAVRHEKDERDRVAVAQERAHATLGHELRAPLNAVQAYSSLLLDGLLGPLNDRQREGVARIRTSGQHLLSIIENVLDVARINAGAIALATRDVRIEEVVTESLEMLQPVAAAKDQELRVRLRDDLVVRADPDRLRQALVNLVGNAIKYSRRGEAVELEGSTVERDGRRCAAIAVTDTGPGISPSVIATIFEPFVRGGADDVEPGLGLGLFISRELVRRMGGDIEVESEPGVGSTFTAFVPLA